MPTYREVRQIGSHIQLAGAKAQIVGVWLTAEETTYRVVWWDRNTRYTADITETEIETLPDTNKHIVVGFKPA